MVAAILFLFFYPYIKEGGAVEEMLIGSRLLALIAAKTSFIIYFTLNWIIIY